MAPYKKIQAMMVSEFKGYTCNKSYKTINILSWLLQDDEYLKSIVLNIRKSTNKDEVRQLKSKLPAITPSGIFRMRRADMMEQHSGLICIDIDGKDNPHLSSMESVKEVLSRIPYIMYVGLSVSGKGLFCLIKIAHPEEHKQHFNALQAEFKQLDINIDESCSDVCRLRGYSFDPKPYVNPSSRCYHNLGKRNAGYPVPMLEIDRTKRMLTGNEMEPSSSQLPSFDEQLELLINPPALEIGVLTKPLSARIDELIHRVLETEMDITSAYLDWFAICCILVYMFREEGRERFHQLSQFYPNYTREECDMKYNECLSHHYTYKSDLLFEVAKRHGL